MNARQKEQMSCLLKSVFDGSISNDEFRNETAKLLELGNGEPYPKFVWKADHYITDEDLCIEDVEYEEMMRTDILSLFEEYFSETQSS